MDEKIRALIAQYEEAQLRDRLESEARLNARAALIADLKRLLEPQDEGATNGV